MIHAGECGRVCQPSILTRIVQRHNKKRLLALVLAYRNPENFTNPKQEVSKRPLGYVYPAAEHPRVDCSVWWHFIFGVGVTCLFLLVGSFRNLDMENKQRVRFHAFFVVKIAGSEPTAKKMTCYSTHLSSQSFSQ